MIHFTLSDLSSVRAVVQRIIDGERDLYAEIVKATDKDLYKVGRSYGFDHETTEDLMQDTFVNAYMHLKDFQFKAALKTWLTRIMIHQCYHKKYRSRSRREVSSDQISHLSGVPLFRSGVVRPDAVVANLELKKHIEKAILEMPEDYRIVFTLRELNGLNTRDTAEVLGLSENNVKVRLSRAKAALRSELQKTYPPVELFEFNLVYCEPLVARVMAEIGGM